MFQPSDKFYTNIQLNSVVFESQGIVVQEAFDTVKRRKLILIEKSTSDENEYAELQKDICAFDKTDNPHLLKVHRYTYDLVIPETTKITIKDYGTNRQQNLFARSGSQVLLSTQQGSGNQNSNKKIYKLTFLTDFFTTNLKLWIEKKRDELDKSSNSYQLNSIFQKGNIRKGLPQYEYCSILNQMVEAVNDVFIRENKKNNSSLKDYVCKVDISAENFVVNETVDLESKIKFIPMHFLTIYSKNQKKRFTSLIDHQEKYIMKRRQTLELQHEMIFNSIQASNKKINNTTKYKSFTNFLETDLSSIKSGIQSNTNINLNMNMQQEDQESKYLRQLFDLGLKIGSLYIGTDNFTESFQPLSQLARQVFSDVYKSYRNVSTILVKMIDSNYYSNIPSINIKKGNLASICSDLRKINDQEYQSDENYLGGVNEDQNDELDQILNGMRNISPKKSQNLLQISKQNSQLSISSSGSLTAIPNDFGNFDQSGQKQRSFSQIKNGNFRKSSQKFNENKYLEQSPIHQSGKGQIEIYDVDSTQDKKPKKYKGLAFITPYTSFLNIIHINEKKNAYMEKIEIKQSEKVFIPYEHSSIVVPGVGEYKVYILGGSESITVYEFDSNQDGKLNKKQNMIATRERKNFGMCLFDGETKIFIATGIKDEQITTQSEIYDIQNNTWQKCSNVNVPLVGSTLCLFNKYSVYKFGGVDQSGKLTKSIEKYDIFQDQWKTVQYDIDPYLQQGISFSKNMLSIQINNNQIVIFGGENTTSNQRHPFYQVAPPNSKPPTNMNHKIFFCHVDKLGHHELFGIDQYGFVPDNAGYLLPGQIALSGSEILFFQKQLYRSDTGKLMGFSVENQVRDVRGKDIRF